MGRGEAIARAIERVGIGALLARVPTWRGVVVLGYHRIGRPGNGVHDTSLWSATQEDFDQQLRFLARHMQPVSGDELPRALAEPRGRHVALTFDDGYRDNYELAYPALRAQGVPAVFFVATGFLDDPHVAWWDEIAWMVRSSTRRELAPADGPAMRLPLQGPNREAAILTLLDAFQRLPQERTGAFLDWLAAADRIRPGGSGCCRVDVDDLGHGARDAPGRDGLRRPHGQSPRSGALLSGAPAAGDRGLGGARAHGAGRADQPVQLSHRRRGHVRRAHA